MPALNIPLSSFFIRLFLKLDNRLYCIRNCSIILYVTESGRRECRLQANSNKFILLFSGKNSCLENLCQSRYIFNVMVSRRNNHNTVTVLAIYFHCSIANARRCISSCRFCKNIHWEHFAKCSSNHRRSLHISCYNKNIALSDNGSNTFYCLIDH